MQVNLICLFYNLKIIDALNLKLSILNICSNIEKNNHSIIWEYKILARKQK